MAKPQTPNSDFDRVELITNSQRALYGYIFSLVGSRDLADEILQDTNVVLCEKFDEFDGRVKFSTWACRVAYFEVLNRRKRDQRDRLAFVDESMLQELSAVAAGEADLADVRLPALRECIGELPPHSRDLIERRYEAGGSVASIAEDLERSPAGVRVTLHRIRNALLECILKRLAADENETGTNS